MQAKIRNGGAWGNASSSRVELSGEKGSGSQMDLSPIDIADDVRRTCDLNHVLK